MIIRPNETDFRLTAHSRRFISLSWNFNDDKSSCNTRVVWSFSVLSWLWQSEVDFNCKKKCFIQFKRFKHNLQNGLCSKSYNFRQVKNCIEQNVPHYHNFRLVFVLEIGKVVMNTISCDNLRIHVLCKIASKNFIFAKMLRNYTYF